MQVNIKEIEKIDGPLMKNHNLANNGDESIKTTTGTRIFRKKKFQSVGKLEITRQLINQQKHKDESISDKEMR